MDTRGAAETLVCPRCGAESPPDGRSLIHCQGCKLTYDAKPRPRRTTTQPPPVLDVEIPGITVERTRDALVLRFTEVRWLGVILGSFGLACAAVGLVQPWGIETIIYGSFALVTLGMALLWIGTRSVRIDAIGVSRRAWPWPRRRHARGEIVTFSVDEKDNGEGPVWWAVSVITQTKKHSLIRTNLATHAHDAMKLVDGAFTSYE